MFDPIGYVQSPVKEKVDAHWGSVVSDIVLDKELMPGLTGLESFSHALIVCHLHEAEFIKEEHLMRRPQSRADMPEVGIFAQRVKDRPNPIGVTAVKIVSVDGNILRVQGLDAIDNTPVLDIKPYFPRFDLKENAKVPEWADRLMQGYF